MINEIHAYGSLYYLSYIKTVPVHMEFNGTASSNDVSTKIMKYFFDCYVRFEVPTPTDKNSIFFDITPYNRMKVNGNAEGKCRLHLHSKPTKPA